MNGSECGLIGDACVSMRVCFDSLCFSSTQQRLADEEDATQLQSNRVVGSLATVTTAGLNNATTTAAVTTTLNDGAMPHFGNQISLRSTPPAMDTLRDLQELLRVKDEKIMELETLLCKRDIEIQDLRSHLDKFLSVLPFKSPLTPTKPRPRKQRAQGISAEPPLQQLTPLNFYDKSDRSVIFFLSFEKN